jgi:hypothetical protein
MSEERSQSGRSVDALEQPARAATVTVYPNGPMVLRGDFVITDVDGNEFDGGRIVALCRCGRSAVKPWCDGSHKRGAIAGCPDD